jgi:hypothetical protein
MEPERIRVITPVTGEALGNAEFAHSEGQLADGSEQELLPDP